MSKGALPFFLRPGVTQPSVSAEAVAFFFESSVCAFDFQQEGQTCPVKYLIGGPFIDAL